ncbi:MAG TPA: dephospho-CoA kinase [Candidatus Hydrogenedentes bacterium]|nr:dephospho-CoA kinase [Candidatus Hydrogenedentota bacterium]
MDLYGLTGGTGSGKSEAARRFIARGIPVIDADVIGHEVIAPGGAAEQKIIAAFGQTILSCGKIDREKLSAVVFRDADARMKLNAVVHPAIFEEIARRCAALEAEGRHAVIIDAALLGEGGVREPWLKGFILVVCPEAERIRRLTAMRGIDEEEVKRRIAAQTPPESKRALADWVINNDGSIEALHAQVDAIAEAIHGQIGRS